MCGRKPWSRSPDTGRTAWSTGWCCRSRWKVRSPQNWQKGAPQRAPPAQCPQTAAHGQAVSTQAQMQTCATDSIQQRHITPCPACVSPESALHLVVVGRVEAGLVRVARVREPAKGHLDLVVAAPDGERGMVVQPAHLVRDLLVHLPRAPGRGISNIGTACSRARHAPRRDATACMPCTPALCSPAASPRAPERARQLRRALVKA